MNQVLEFLAENYIYVAGGSLAIIIILIIIIAVGNKKNKNRMNENVGNNDMAALAPQPITGMEPIKEPSLESVPPVSTVADPVSAPVEPVASTPVQEVFSSVNAPISAPVVPEIPTTPVEEPVSAPVVEVPTVETNVETPNVAEPVTNVTTENPNVQAGTVVNDTSTQSNATSVNPTTEVKKDTADLEVFNIE